MLGYVGVQFGGSKDTSEKFLTGINSVWKVDFICFFRLWLFNGNMWDEPFTKVKINKKCIDFLDNPFLLFGMKMSQPHTVFKVTKTGLYAPSAGIEVF